MKKRTFSPILALMGALLLAFVVSVFSTSPFGERDVAYAQTAGSSSLSNLVLMSGNENIDLDFAWNDYDYGNVDAIPVPNRDSTLRVNATPNVLGSPVKVYSSTVDGTFTAAAVAPNAIDPTNSDDIDAESASRVPIDVGTNHIAIEVTSLDDVSCSVSVRYHY